MLVSSIQKHEVLLMNLEVEDYFAQGLELKPGDTVFDVGANIGLFSLAAFHRCGRDLCVYAFEPVRSLHDLLCRNIERNASSARIEALAYGLSDEAGPVQMAYYPRASALSTAYPDEEADIGVMREAVLNTIMHLDEAPLAVQCLRWIPQGIRSGVVQFALRRALRPLAVTCEMRTLSRFVRERGIQRIDFLKIDVEKAELDVLRGIEPEDWRKIRQVVVEVHDIGDNIRTITSLLGQNGLSEIAVSQAPTLAYSNIHLVAASRP